MTWLERFGITDYKNKKVEELSKGNQQKIQFISVVLHKPELLILDEPFSGLDPVNVELLKEAVISLKNSGVSIVFQATEWSMWKNFVRICAFSRRENPSFRAI